MKRKISKKSKRNLSLPALGHVGVVVRDIEKTIEFYSSVFGIGPLDIYQLHPDKVWLRGKEVEPFRSKSAVTNLGPVKLELMEVVEGELPHRDFLETHGEGLQHLGFYVDNYDEWKSYVQEKGIEILTEAEAEDEVRGKRRGFYMDSAKIGGVLFEIIEQKPVQK